MTSRKTTTPKKKSPTNAAVDERQRLRLLKRRLLFKSVTTVKKAAAAAAAAATAVTTSAAVATEPLLLPPPAPSVPHKRHRTFGLSLQQRRKGVRRQATPKQSPKRKSQRLRTASDHDRQPDAKRSRLNGAQAMHMTAAAAHQYDENTSTTTTTHSGAAFNQPQPRQPQRPLYAQPNYHQHHHHRSMDDAAQGLDTRLNGIHMNHTGGAPPLHSNGNKSSASHHNVQLHSSNHNNSNNQHHHQQQQQLSAIHSAAAPPLPPGKQISAATMATLGNIGNTCYLNSVIYTLRFAPHFLHNLHHLVEDLAQVTQRLNGAAAKAKSSSLGRNVGGLAGTNSRSWSTKDLASMSGGGSAATPLGSGSSVTGGSASGLPLLSAADMPRTQRQIATEKLHDLFSALRRNEVSDSPDAFHAGNFLGAVQDVSAIFEGNQQQDAHEFLMCVLDAIRETCQALTRVIGECPDIIMNGYVNVPEKIEPAPTIQHTPSLRKFFGISKSKPSRLDSPSKESVAGAATTHTAPTDAYTPAAAAASVDASKCPATDGGTDATDGNATSSSSCGKKDEAKAKQLSDRIRELGLDFFTEDFEGVTVSSTKCLSCETVTEQKETMIDLSVPITGYESQDKLADQFIQDLCITREYFNSENKYRCEVCTGLTEAIRTVSYPVLPRLLIIQLKRFSGGMEKINSFIPTPFTMQCFCSRCCALPDGDKLHVYRLYSVITHVGATLSVGHYIAYTSALDGYGDSYSCPKVKRKTAQQLQLQQQQQQQQQQLLANGTATKFSTSSGTTTGHGMPPVPQPSSTSSDKNPGILKKYIWGRSKASSSGDVTKQMKGALNGITGSGGGSLKHHNSMTNGSGHGLGTNTSSSSRDSASSGDAAARSAALAANATACTSLTCCGIMTKPIGGAATVNGHSAAHTNGLDGASSKSGSLYSASSASSDYYSASTTTAATAATVGLNPTTGVGQMNGGGGSSSTLETSSTTPPTSTTPNGSIGGGSTSNGQTKTSLPPPPPADTTWYMCDDDKIKALSQREFEELLSPNSKKIMITPYLLFYARSSLQP